MRMDRWASVLVVLACNAATARGQEEVEARSRALSERMRTTLAAQARELSTMQRELERATRADGRVRDSIVRVTSRRIAELAGEIARVQMEADRVQSGAVDAETRAVLRAQISSARAMANVTRALAGQQRQLIFSSRSEPRGYLGVVLESEQRTRVRDGKVFTEFVSPSVVLSVSAGSPAANAGVEAGDTIVALGRAALPGEVLMSEVVKPGERLPVKLRRGGSERVVTVTVGADPNSRNAPTLGYYEFTAEAPCGGDECAPPTPGARAGRVTITGRLAPPAPAPPRVAGAVPPRPPSPLFRALEGTTNWSAADYPFAGAMMTTITEDLQELTGVDEGILVLRVAPGTPAASSGMRGGDVIIRVNDEECGGVRDLQRAVQRASSRGARSVSLVVNRKKKNEQAITLQW
jgi:C-terminal processing protease CtpA/Prc